MMLNPNDVFVLAIDLQEKLVKATNAQKEISNAAKIVNAAKILDIPVIVTEQYPQGLGQTVESVAEFFDDKTKMFEKNSFSALREENILSATKNTGKKQVILFGIELHICVLQTALDLINEGFEIYLIKDACKSRKDFEFETALDVLKSAGTHVICLEIALFELLKTFKHQHFKEIQALIK